jgi:hypothetical protein
VNNHRLLTSLSKLQHIISPIRESFVPYIRASRRICLSGDIEEADEDNFSVAFEIAILRTGNPVTGLGMFSVLKSVDLVDGAQESQWEFA